MDTEAVYGGSNQGRFDVDRLRTVPGRGCRCRGATAGVGSWRSMCRGSARTRYARRSACCATSTGARRQPRSSFRVGPALSWLCWSRAPHPGPRSRTAIPDAVRLAPADDATAITAVQSRGVVERLIAAGHWQAGDSHIVIVSDAGYDITRLAWVLRDLPAELVGPATTSARPSNALRPSRPSASLEDSGRSRTRCGAGGFRPATPVWRSACLRWTGGEAGRVQPVRSSPGESLLE